jgi:hypothetical protein
MLRSTCGIHRRIVLSSAFWIFVCAAASNVGNALAQASIEPRGFGSVSLSFLAINHTGPILTDGTPDRGGRSVNRDIDFEVNYGVTDRLTLSAGIPFVSSKYTDAAGKRTLNSVDQCRCWNSGFQDFRFKARYNVIGHPHSALLITPSVFVGVPSHAYQYQGEAVFGRDLKELQLGMDVRRRIDAISQNFYIQGNYTHAFVERVLDIPNNRSNTKLEGVFLLTERLSLEGRLTWQHSHGGLRSGSPTSATFAPPGDFTTQETLDQLDRLLRDNYLRTGIGVNYSLQRMNLFADFSGFISGSDTHRIRALALGVNFPFQLRRFSE